MTTESWALLIQHATVYDASGGPMSLRAANGSPPLVRDWAEQPGQSSTRPD